MKLGKVVKAARPTRGIENSQMRAIHPQRRSYIRASVPPWFLCVPLFAMAVSLHAQPEFLAPVAITDSALNYRLARTSSSAMQFDSTGRLHLAYWAGADQTTSADPSFIFYRNWAVGEGWSAQETVDDSFDGQARLGGRQPSLALLSNDTVAIAWHDHRHGTAGLGYNDNTEIYIDYRSPGGSFSPTDIRLTTTAAGGTGDNGFTPRLYSTDDGSLALGWYDFNANGAVSDIYFSRSDTNGIFNTAAPISSHRATDETTRGGTPAFTVPDIVANGSNAYITWLGGTASVFSPMYFGRISSGPGFDSIVTLSGNGNFLDPPRVLAAPDGDIWVVYTDTTTPSNFDIRAYRFNGGDPTSATDMTLRGATSRESAPMGAFDSTGNLRLVWVDGIAPNETIRTGLFDPTLQTWSEEEELSAGAGDYDRPTVTFDSDGNAVVIYEERLSPSTGRLWFTRQSLPLSAEGWNLYR